MTTVQISKTEEPAVLSLIKDLYSLPVLRALNTGISFMQNWIKKSIMNGQ